MIGVIFAKEMERASHSRFARVTRWTLGCWLAILFLVSYASVVTPLGTPEVAGLAARNLIDSVTFQLFAVLCLAGPAFAAGSVTDEKVRGTMELLFLTEVGPGAIIFGKLLARVAQGFVLSLTAWPILAFVGVTGGLTPAFFGCLAIVTVLMLAGTCGASLLASVWSRSTRNAAVTIYAIIGLIAIPLIAYLESTGARNPLTRLIAALDPLYVLDAARDQPNYAELRHRLGQTILAWSLIAVPTTVIAILRLRPVFFKQQQGRLPSRITRRLLTRPPILNRPVAWAEQYAGRKMPLLLGLLITSVISVFLVEMLVRSNAPTTDLNEQVTYLMALVAALFGIAAGARGSACVTAERDRRTWDVLTSTPMNFDVMLREKSAGILQSLWPYFFAFLIPTMAMLTVKELLASPSSEIATWFAFVLILVLLALGLLRWMRIGFVPAGLAVIAIAVSSYSGYPAFVAVFAPIFAYTAMSYMAGVGAWFSVRSKNSWISLLGTMVGGFALSLLVMTVSIPVGCLSCCFMPAVVGLMGALVRDLSNNDQSLLAVIILSGSCTAGFAWLGFQATLSAARYLDRHDRVPNGFMRTIELDLPRSIDENSNNES